MHTPWGVSDGQETLAPGIIFYTTPSHGGYHVSPTLVAKMPVPYQETFCGRPGWYEEDCDWAKVALSFPQFFTPEQLAAAEVTAKSSFPYAYEAVNNVVLVPGESHTKDDDNFLRDHAADWLNVVGYGDWLPGVQQGFCLIGATLGGKRGNSIPVRHFFVPSAEYHAYHFVIDLARHEEAIGFDVSAAYARRNATAA